MSHENVRELARFLGANSAAWTRTNRERLRVVLSDVGGGIVDPIVGAMIRLPRTDILDECEFVLRRLPKDALPEMWRLVQERARLAASIRAALLRASVRVDSTLSLPTLLAALYDPDSEVRETAASLFGEIGGTRAREALEGRLTRETDAAVVASLHEALESLAG
jgi:HEAT repeat protein